jgi:hypothetical protein
MPIICKACKCLPIIEGLLTNHVIPPTTLVLALGATVRLNVFSGGHALAPWRGELEPALEWFIGTPKN